MEFKSEHLFLLLETERYNTVSLNKQIYETACNELLDNKFIEYIDNSLELTLRGADVLNVALFAINDQVKSGSI